MIRILAPRKNPASFESTAAPSFSAFQFTRLKFSTSRQILSGVSDSLVPPTKTLPFIPSKTIVLTINDKVYQHVGSNAHSTIISFGMDIGGQPLDSSDAQPARQSQSIKALCKTIRLSLSTTLSSTFWQLNMLGARQIHFQCTRIPDANASIILNVLMQRVIEFTESLQYRLKDCEGSPQAYSYDLSQTYCTCTPDARKAGLQTNAHFFIFRRKVGPYEAERDAHGAADAGEALPEPPKGSRVRIRRVKRRKAVRQAGGSTVERGGQTEPLKKSVLQGVGPEIPREIHRQMENLWPDR